jgi:hypothetical protein
MSLASTSMNLFVFTTIIYFIVHYYINRKQHKIINYMYYGIIIASQLVIIYLQSKDLCGTPQVSSVFIWGLIPWFFLFFGLITLLDVFPGWKSPFSNTIGYLFTKILGITSLFNSLLKSKFTSDDKGLNKIFQNVYEDQSVLINEMTPNNFDNAIDKLKSIFNTTSPDYTSNIEKLRKMVLLKDEVSRFIWYVLTGGLVVSISNMGITTTKCEKDIKQVKREMNAYNAAIAKNKQLEIEQKKNQKQYIIKD